MERRNNDTHTHRHTSQYMCMNNGTDDNYPMSSSKKSDEVIKRVMYMRDGTSTNTQVGFWENQKLDSYSYLVVT